jgi:hypothetical protein
MSDISDSPGGNAQVSVLDTSILPLGERALQSILDHVTAVGDEAESTYLEVKSSLDMTSKLAVAKIAKFLLGAANRQPAQAARHFHGHAVLVIGAEKGQPTGVPRGTEPHELEDGLRPYLGPTFPTFEFGRITVDSGSEVLFIVAQPPQEGQPIFPCHKDFQGEDRRDGLEDGAIYVRGTSNTRPARSGEVLSLVERARGGGKRPIDLDVEVLGPINRVTHVDQVLEELLKYEEQNFLKPPDRPEPDDFSPLPLPANIFGSVKPMSTTQRDEALATWQSNKANHIAQGRTHLLGVALAGSSLRLTSHHRYIAKPRLTVTFHDCEALDHVDPDDADYKKAVEPVVKAQHPFGAGLDLPILRSIRGDYPVSWTNCGEDAEITLSLDSLRPEDTWSSDQDDYVIVARNPEASDVEVSWTLTEDGSDDVTTGTFRVPTQELSEGRELFISAFYAEKA